MKILHFATDDVTGGAAKASYRLHSAQRRAGHTSRIIVRHKRSRDPDVLETRPPVRRPRASRWERLRRFLPISMPPEPTAAYAFNFDREPPIDRSSLFQVPKGEVDVVCLHWITGLLDVRSIGELHAHYRRPIVWIPADLEPMTGGCHYAFGCDGFTRECGSCPQLVPGHANDNSRVVWRRKRDVLGGMPLTFVAPTGWVRDRIRESSLFGSFPVFQIAYPIDPAVFRPFDQRVARDLLHLPQDRKLIFFGARYLHDRRKGIELLLAALRRVASMLAGDSSVRPNDVYLLVAGSHGDGMLDAVPFEGRTIGEIDNDLILALAYQAADIFVCPSVEDAGPMMIPEAMLCGTPVVAFDSGGGPDLIRHRENGYLARWRDEADLAEGIRWILSLPSTADVRKAATARALELHSPDVVARRHIDLYRSLSIPADPLSIV